MEKSDHRDRRLLRARRPRHRRVAEQRDELATLQSIESHLLPQPGTSWAAYRIGHYQVRGLPQCRISTRPMSESGQNATFPSTDMISASPPKADISEPCWQVRVHSPPGKGTTAAQAAPSRP